MAATSPPSSPPSPADLARAKAALRRQLRAARRAHVARLGAAARARAEAALAAWLLPQLAGAPVVAVYAATGAEIRPDPTTAGLLAAGRQVAYPRVAGQVLEFRVCPPAALVSGHRGIPEPPVTAPAVRPELLLLPLVGASHAGWRLGQGGGFYDRSLAELRAQGPLRAIGLAWDLQLLDRIPHQPHDQRLDAIATPSGFWPTAFHPAPHPATDRA